MKSVRPLLSFLLLCWMAAVVLAFALVTVPPEGRLGKLLPPLFWHMRDTVFPLFFSTAVI